MRGPQPADVGLERAVRKFETANVNAVLSIRHPESSRQTVRAPSATVSDALVRRVSLTLVS